MHRTIKWIIAAALVLSLCATSFAIAEESFYLELPSKGITSTRKISVTIPEENPVIDGINPLTGEVWSGPYHPIGVNIDQHPGALPNWGVSSADIIFEMPIQADGSTRAFALFMGDIPSYAGPVRSGRVPMASLREIFGGAWVFYGWQNTVVKAGALVVDVDSWALNMHKDARQGGRWVFPYVEGTERNYANLFHREKDGMHVAPYNVQIDMHAVDSLFDEEPQKRPFKFSDTGLEEGTDVSSITINYKTTKPQYIVDYKYNDMTGLYERYRNGESYYDALNGMATSFANVIVMRTDVSWFNNNNSRPVIQTVGQGVAEIFQNGKYIRGTWVRSHSDKEADDFDSQSARLIFLDENGEEIAMKVGKTFIQIVDNDQSVIVTAGEAIEGAAAQATPKPTATPRPTRTPKPTRTPRADRNSSSRTMEVEEDGDISFGG
ncbi:MAG: DUF3048 C-terminal domain-containing protein [Clostridia bacterium]|nr:DUF3048 C-terminal domain-containing protein [Clostridia bacterium]